MQKMERARWDSRTRWRTCRSIRRKAGCCMFSRCLSVLLLALPALCADTHVLRVCADPNNLPFSNEAGEGFENRLAEMIARDMGAKLEYTWWSQRKSFVKNSLDAGRCDVLLGVPADLRSVNATK